MPAVHRGQRHVVGALRAVQQPMSAAARAAVHEVLGHVEAIVRTPLSAEAAEITATVLRQVRGLTKETPPST
jgi:hypothetical protein